MDFKYGDVIFFCEFRCGLIFVLWIMLYCVVDCVNINVDFENGVCFEGLY